MLPNLTPPDLTPSDILDFWARVEKTDTCWLWRGLLTRDGYGRFYTSYREFRAHRLAWWLTYGEWPPDSLDHLCRVRHCVNAPDHLESVTIGENVRRGGPTVLWKMYAARTACSHGHEYTPETTYYRKDRPGRRECLTCHHIRRYGNR